MNCASFVAENNPLDLAFGKLDGIGGGGDPPPRVAALDFDLEGRLAGILPSIHVGRFKADSKPIQSPFKALGRDRL